MTLDALRLSIGAELYALAVRLKRDGRIVEHPKTAVLSFRP